MSIQAIIINRARGAGEASRQRPLRLARGDGPAPGLASQRFGVRALRRELEPAARVGGVAHHPMRSGGRSSAPGCRGALRVWLFRVGAQELGAKEGWQEVQAAASLRTVRAELPPREFALDGAEFKYPAFARALWLGIAAARSLRAALAQNAGFCRAARWDLQSSHPAGDRRWQLPCSSRPRPRATCIHGHRHYLGHWLRPSTAGCVLEVCPD